MSTEGVFVFLRAVNLGARNKVPMKELQAAIEREGLGECRYLLQSGNLIFREFDGDVPGLRRSLERLVDREFGVATGAVARTPPELRELLDANPFTAPEGGSVQISMWDEVADPDGLRMLAERDFGPDRLFLRAREAIMRFESSSHGSKLGNALIERRLKVPATARNVRTLERLLTLD